MEPALLQPPPSAALPLEHVHRHRPAAAELADDPVAGHPGVVEEDLREMVLAVFGADRAHLDPRLVEVDQHHREALVARPARAGEQDGTLGEMAVRRPHLLARQAVAVAVGLEPCPQRCQVAARVWLGERLSPALVAAQQRRQQLVGEMRSEHQQHGHEDFECGERLWDLDVQLPQCLEHRCPKTRVAAEAASTYRPTESGPSGIEQQRLQAGHVT